jgi:hypothetical protein
LPFVRDPNGVVRERAATRVSDCHLDPPVRLNHSLPISKRHDVWALRRLSDEVAEVRDRGEIELLRCPNRKAEDDPVFEEFLLR